MTVTPEAAKQLMEKWAVHVERSPTRIIKDAEYEKVGGGGCGWFALSTQAGTAWSAALCDKSCHRRARMDPRPAPTSSSQQQRVPRVFGVACICFPDMFAAVTPTSLASL